MINHGEGTLRCWSLTQMVQIRALGCFLLALNWVNGKLTKTQKLYNKQILNILKIPTCMYSLAMENPCSGCMK